MKRSVSIVLLDGVPVADDADKAGFLVRQVVMEATRILASGQLPNVRAVSVEVAATQLVLKVHVFGETEQQLDAATTAADLVWKVVADRALRAAVA